MHNLGSEPIRVIITPRVLQCWLCGARLPCFSPERAYIRWLDAAMLKLSHTKLVAIKMYLGFGCNDSDTPRWKRPWLADGFGHISSNEIVGTCKCITNAKFHIG